MSGRFTCTLQAQDERPSKGKASEAATSQLGPRSTEFGRRKQEVGELSGLHRTGNHVWRMQDRIAIASREFGGVGWSTLASGLSAKTSA